jgi:serine protease Do
MQHATCTRLCWIVFGAAASCAFAQQPAPQPRAATNRSIYIRKSGSSYLGIGVAEIDAERAKALKLKEVRGVEVKSVDSGSPAAKAGLKEGDVVLEYNGQGIEGTEQFVRLVHETPVERQVKLEVWRNGANQTLNATIGRRADNFALMTPEGDESFTIEGPAVPAMPPMPPMPETPTTPWMAPMPPAAPMMGDFAQVMRAHSGMLGVECESLGDQLAAFFGVKDGVLVREVYKDSPAEKAGIRAGDVIVKMDGETVTSAREISSVLRAARTKHTFPVIVVRDKKEMTITVTVEHGSRGFLLTPSIRGWESVTGV